MGRNAWGFETLIDSWTNDHIKQVRKDFISIMNIGQTSKHFAFVFQQAKEYVLSQKTGDEVNIKESLWVFIFDVIFKIIFGKNAYDLLNEIEYKDPF